MSQRKIPESSFSEQHDESDDKSNKNELIDWKTVTCFSSINSFYFDLSSDSSCCSERTFWNLPLTHWWAITYWSQKCCLVILDSPLYIKRLSCLRERTIRFRIHSQLSFFQQDHKLDSLDYNFRLCHQFSSRSWPIWLCHQSVSILLHQAYFSIRSQRLSISFKEYVEYLLRCTNLEVKFLWLCFCYLLLGNQKVALNNCISDTTRYSVWHAGLLLINNLSWTETGSLTLTRILTPHLHPSHLTRIPHTSPASAYIPHTSPTSLTPCAFPSGLAWIPLPSPASCSHCLHLPHLTHISLTLPVSPSLRPHPLTLPTSHWSHPHPSHDHVYPLSPSSPMSNIF